MIQYKVDVRPILEEIGGSLSVDGEFDLRELVVGDEEFTLTQPASFSAVVTNAGAGIVATGSVQASVAVSCVRCLCDFTTLIEGEIEGFYVEEGQERGNEDDTEEVDAAGAIDLASALVAALVVEAPFAPLHDEECAGLCAQCGADLNSETCSCVTDIDDDHPLAALKNVVVKDDPSSTADQPKEE